MDRPYNPNEINVLTTMLENVLAARMEGLHMLVRDTCLLGVLRRQLEAYGGALPIGLMPLKDIVQKTHEVYVELCAEGPYEGLPVA